MASLHYTTSLAGIIMQQICLSTLPHHCAIMGSKYLSIHCLIAVRQWAMVILQHIA